MHLKTLQHYVMGVQGTDKFSDWSKVTQETSSHSLNFLKFLTILIKFTLQYYISELSGQQKLQVCNT